MACQVCKLDRPLKFHTPRLSICNLCANTLNHGVYYTPGACEKSLLDEYRGRVRYHLHRDVLTGDAATEARAQSILDGDFEGYVQGRFPAWFDRVLRDRPSEYRDARLIRAHRLGLTCVQRSFLDYPANWPEKAQQVRAEAGLRCAKCGQQSADLRDLHVHHIVFRSRSGTNRMANLVALCFDCHQLEHFHPITRFGGEARGSEADTSHEEFLPSPDGPDAAPATATQARHFNRELALQVAGRAEVRTPPAPRPTKAPEPLPAPAQPPPLPAKPTLGVFHIAGLIVLCCIAAGAGIFALALFAGL